MAYRTEYATMDDAKRSLENLKREYGTKIRSLEESFEYALDRHYDALADLVADKNMDSMAACMKTLAVFQNTSDINIDTLSFKYGWEKALEWRDGNQG